MLNKNDFDLWADGYDITVGISEEENTYPFAGYRDVLGNIFHAIMEKPNATVLDIGFGTGTLTTKLYEHGCSIYGQDFSSGMIELASGKMPGSHLYQGDFTKGLVEPLRNQCRQEAGDEWDDEELYFVADELRSAFPNITFRQISYCAGILTLTR